MKKVLGSMSKFIFGGFAIAVEMDPRDLRPEVVEAFARLGVNRASIGVPGFAVAELIAPQNGRLPTVTVDSPELPRVRVSGRQASPPSTG